MNKKLRLLVTEKCNRDCDGCCNKEYNLKSLPVVQDFSKYEMIMLTGGEPMLYAQKLISTIKGIREDSEASVILYTANISNPSESGSVMAWIDGMTLTLHEKSDVMPFLNMNAALLQHGIMDKSLRLNVFAGVYIPSETDLSLWEVKDSMEWIKDCPIPEGEDFMRLTTALDK